MTRRGVALRRIVRSAGIVLLAASLACSGQRDEKAADAGGDDASATSSARRAPGFALQDLSGATVSLESLRGKTVLIDFWATWCPPCEFQIPVLNAFHEAHKDQGVVVLGVAVDAEGREVVAPYAASHEIRYPVLLGNEALARDFGAPGFPALAVVAPDGSLAQLHVGLVEAAELEASVAKLAGAPPAAGAARPPASPGS